MGITIDLTGQTFGRLTVVSRSVAQRGNSYWNCRCVCGVERRVSLPNLRSGHVRSCGCLSRESRATRSTIHGHARVGARTREYSSWHSMVSRCTNPNIEPYAKYGARGIKVCARWLDFVNFLADMGERPPNTSLDRIDNDGNYEPGNCRWATASEQMKNRRPFKRNRSQQREPCQTGIEIRNARS
jgi:hypothetical protein